MEPQPTSDKPAVWPGAFGIYKTSRRAVLLNLWPLVAVYLLTLVVSGLISSVFDSSSWRPGEQVHASGSLLSFVLNLLISSVGTIAVTTLLLAGVRGIRLGFQESFRNVQELVLPMIGQLVLQYIIILLSLIAFIIPFFFVMPRLMLAPYFLVDKKLGAVDSIKASWTQTGGNVGKVWGIIGVSFLMALLMLTIIGIPFAIYFLVMYSAATAILYRYITENDADASGQVAPVIPTVPKS